MMQQQSQGPLKIKATKGFYAHTSTGFGVVNPGDVVSIDRQVATMLIASNKAQVTEEKESRATEYLPERKKIRKPDVATQLEALTSTVTTLSKAVEALVAAQAKSKTETK